MNSPNQPTQRWLLPAVIAFVMILIGAVIWFSSATNREPNVSPPPPPESGAPDPQLAEGRNWDVVLHTSAGQIEFILDGEQAPQAAASFIQLTQEGFFNGTECHRLLPSALLQCGDPTGTGRGGPDYQFGPIENAPSDNMYRAGTVAMARVGGDAYSMGSQFFLVFEDVFLQADRAGGYSVMGTIGTGLQVLKDIAGAGTVDGSTDAAPLTSVIIESVEVK